MLLSLCLVRDLASRLERSLGIMDVAGVANPCFHPILSSIDPDLKPRILPIIQHLYIPLYLGKTISEQGDPKNAVFGVSYMSLSTKTGASFLCKWAEYPKKEAWMLPALLMLVFIRFNLALVLISSLTSSQSASTCLHYCV